MTDTDITALVATIFLLLTQIPFVPMFNSYSRGDIYDIPPIFVGKYWFVTFFANQPWLVLVYLLFLYGFKISIIVFISSFFVVPILIRPIYLSIIHPLYQVQSAVIMAILGNITFLYLMAMKLL